MTLKLSNLFPISDEIWRSPLRRYAHRYAAHANDGLVNFYLHRRELVAEKYTCSQARVLAKRDNAEAQLPGERFLHRHSLVKQKVGYLVVLD